MDEELKQRISKALDMGMQFVDVAIDWNFEEVEISGEMQSSYDIKNEITLAKEAFDKWAKESG